MFTPTHPPSHTHTHTHTHTLDHFAPLFIKNMIKTIYPFLSIKGDFLFVFPFSLWEQMRVSLFLLLSLSLFTRTLTHSLPPSQRSPLSPSPSPSLPIFDNLRGSERDSAYQCRDSHDATQIQRDTFRRKRRSGTVSIRGRRGRGRQRKGGRGRGRRREGRTLRRG